MCIISLSKYQNCENKFGFIKSNLVSTTSAYNKTIFDLNNTILMFTMNKHKLKNFNLAVTRFAKYASWRFLYLIKTNMNKKSVVVD